MVYLHCIEVHHYRGNGNRPVEEGEEQKKRQPGWHHLFASALIIMPSIAGFIQSLLSEDMYATGMLEKTDERWALMGLERTGSSEPRE